MEVYLELFFWFLLENLNQLWPLQASFSIVYIHTFSVRTFWPAPARTSHKNRNVRRTHPHTDFCARKRTRTHTNFQNIFQIFFFFKFFLLLKVKFWGNFLHKNGCAVVQRTSATAARPHLQGVHARTHPHAPTRTRTHFSENFSTPLCTKIST